MERTDAIVLGAGPAGLGAALALARAGRRPTVIEAGGEVGGLCRTVSRDGFLYDLGGHILFVRDEGRRAWLEGLLGDDLVWVPRPVAHVEDGRVVSGRYLDLAPATPPPSAAADAAISGRDYLAPRVGAEFADRHMRAYLEKIDGIALEEIPAARVERLTVGQAAPRGFWFCRRGIAQLMHAMANELVARGGRVQLNTRALAIDTSAPSDLVVQTDATPDLTTANLAVGLPAALAARLVRPALPPEAAPDLTMRAVCLVYLSLEQDRLSDEPWIQVDDACVPFSRLAESRNWSAEMAPRGRTVVCAECYCFARDADPVWSLGDAELAAECAEALADPLGLIPDPAAATLLDVVRFRAAYPVVRVCDIPKAQAPWRHLEEISGIEVAQGGAVIEAIEAGERAAERILAG